jgi:hypothetical protein
VKAKPAVVWTLVVILGFLFIVGPMVLISGLIIHSHHRTKGVPPEVEAARQAWKDVEAKQRAESELARQTKADAAGLPRDYDCAYLEDLLYRDEFTAVVQLAEAYVRGFGALDEQEETLDYLRETYSWFEEEGLNPAAGSSLNPDLHTPEELRENLYDFLAEYQPVQDWETAVRQGICRDTFTYGPEVLSFRAMEDAHRDKLNRAIDTTIFLLNLARHAPEYPYFEWAEGYGYYYGFPALAAVLRQPGLQTEALAQLLEAAEPDASLDGLRERMHMVIGAYYDDDVPPVAVAMIGIAERLSGEDYMIAGADEWENVLEARDRLIGLADQPPAEALETLEQLEAVERTEAQEELAASLGEPYFLYWGNHNQAQVPALAQAIELYRSATGAYPETLEALVPDYIESVPIDYFSGESLRFAAQGDSFDLWVNVPKDAYDAEEFGQFFEIRAWYGTPH